MTWFVVLYCVTIHSVDCTFPQEILTTQRCALWPEISGGAGHKE